MKWSFKEVSPDDVEIDHSIDELFNNNEVNIQETLVRETIQNSLDAIDDLAKPVEIRFAFKIFEKGTFPRLLTTGLDRHIKGKLSAVPDWKSDSINVLLVEDFNTKGIGGPTNKKKKGTNWYGFFWAMGRSVKSGGAGGRRGLGRNVFGICSKIRSFIALTNRLEDKRSLVMGLSILGMHTIEGIDYQPIGHFAFQNTEGFREPLESPEQVNEIADKLSLSRKLGEPGLSVIIPCADPELAPQSTAEAAAYNYFISIWLEELVVRVQETVLDRSTLKGWLREHPSKRLGNVDELLGFIDETRCFEERFAPKYEGQPKRLLAEHFSEDEVVKMRKRFENGEMIAVSLPLRVHRKGDSPKTGIADLFLRRTENGEAGIDLYRRGNMPVFGERKASLRTAPVFGLFQATDGLVVEMLASAEGAAHWSWNSRHKELSDSYESAGNSVLLAKNCIVDLYNLITAADDQIDIKSFSDLFPIGNEGNDGDPVTPPPPPPPPPKPQIVSISQVGNGLKIIGNSERNADYPLEAHVKFAYLVERRNSFKMFRPADFSLHDNLEVVQAGDVSTSILSPNGIILSATSSDFEIYIKGFDVNRDIEVSLVDLEEGEEK